jgi:polar amino acid transport system substrate-binding protein
VRHAASRSPRLRCCVTALLPLLLLLVMPASPSAQTLAPTGTLRVAFLGTNPVHGRVDAKSGAMTGPIADIVQEVARRLGVPFRLIPAPDPAGVIGHVQGGTADLGAIAYDADRARDVDFAAPFAVMFSSYLVTSASPIRTLADADRQGVEIGAGRTQTQGIFLGTHLRQARLRTFDALPPPAEIQRLLLTGELQAFGLNRQRAEDAASGSAGALRVVPGSFVDVEQSFVVPKGDRARAAEIARLLEELRASGFIAAAIDRAKLVGAAPAPARPATR